jgi:putative endopeptidase
MNRYLLSALTLALLANVAHSADTTKHPKAAKALSTGIEVEYIDPSVRAQDDFFTYLNGKWIKSTEIPADKSSWGSFAKLRDARDHRSVRRQQSGRRHRLPAHRRLLRQLHG